MLFDVLYFSFNYYLVLFDKINIQQVIGLFDLKVNRQCYLYCMLKIIFLYSFFKYCFFFYI